VGGRVVNLSSNARLGTGKYLVAEADEYDRSFLRLAPTIAVVTAIEPEHLECYGDDFELLKRAFLEFMNKVPFYGAVFACADENVVRELIPEVDRRVFTYGIATSADIRALRISFKENRTIFTAVYQEQELGDVEVRLLGLHNVKNSLAAIAVALELGVQFDIIRDALRSFKGVYRRFQIKAELGGIMVVDDYAHHYTEIRATLQGARLGYKGRRIVAIFQPHLFSRTRYFYKELGKALLESDLLFITDIYPAREEPIEGVTGELVYQAARECGHPELYYSKDLENLKYLVFERIRPGDIVITLGAGNINKVGDELIAMLKERYGKPAE
ncbi:MAG: UDP-N-acetylmuramate--L-alanine ligase, partial [bacterium]